MDRIELSVPNLDYDILENMKECIETGWVSTGGRFITEFEDGIKNYVKAGGAKSVQSGTAGLHVALRILNLNENDEIITPTLTFIASSNVIKYRHAEPIFIDCGDDLNIDPDKIEDFLENECYFDGEVVINNRTKNRVKGILVVHVFGNPADMERIMDIAERYNLFVLEDACQALGSYYTSGKYEGKYCGTIGDIGVYSFNANKIITTGNGGIVVSDNLEYLKRVNFLAVQAKSDPWRYKHDEIGYNYRLTNISAAFGLSQLKKISEFIETKKRNYKIYKERLKDIEGLRLLDFNSGTSPNYWFYSLYIEDDFPLEREELMQELDRRGIGSRPIWGLNHLQKPYKNNQAYKIEKAISYSKHVLNIPCSSNLTEEEVNRVCEILEKISKI